MAEIRRPDDMVRITTPELAQAFIDEQIALVKEQVGDKKVLLALSGGVDSSVVAALLIKAIGDQLVCVHVNHGLLRKGEPEQVIEVFRNQMKANLIYVDAVDRFLDLLTGVTDPEQKRHIIGEEFINVFADEARKLEGVEFLAQGTIWPDILESEAGIKAHHNAGGLPEDLNFELVEPVRILFKDEVRVVGEQLGLPAGMVYRQPLPSPATVSKRSASPTPSSAKSSRRTVSKAKSGSTSPSSRTSSPPASRTASAALSGPASSAPSIRPTSSNALSSTSTRRSWTIWHSGSRPKSTASTVSSTTSLRSRRQPSNTNK